MNNELKTTHVNRVYKIELKRLRENTRRISCEYCKYHRDENVKRGNVHKSWLKYDYKVCWKKLRKAQYK